MEKIEKYKPEYYENRELSWLKFNERILGEARDKENLLFERLKFLSITASNLDEFFKLQLGARFLEQANQMKVTYPTALLSHFAYKHFSPHPSPKPLGNMGFLSASRPFSLLGPQQTFLC